jgi:hypothetical protein
METITKKYPIVSITAAILAITLIASAVAGEGSVISGAMIQAKWCGKGNDICLFWYYFWFTIGILLFAFIVQLIVNKIFLHKVIWGKNEANLERKINQLLIRATPTYEESVGITITLLSSANLTFHGELWLKAIVESPKNIRSAIRLLGDEDKKPNVDLPRMPFKTFLLVRIESGEPYYIAEKYKEKMQGSRNYIVTELNGRFDGVNKQIRIENNWYLDFDNKKQTLHLWKDNENNIGE